MRTLKFLMIPAALGAGLLAGQAAQAQPAIVPTYAPSYYGLNPAGFTYGAGYGVITLPPEGFAAMPFDARDFPKVFAPIVGKKP